MALAYPDITIGFSTLESFWVSCLGLENSQAVSPIECNVTNTYIDPNGRGIANQVLGITRRGVLVRYMVRPGVRANILGWSISMDTLAVKGIHKALDAGLQYPSVEVTYSGRNRSG